MDTKHTHAYARFQMLEEDDVSEEQEQFSEPQEDDLVTEDHIHFYQSGHLALTMQVREPPRHVGERGMRVHDATEPLSDTAMWRQLDAFMKKQNFYPSVWFISDHGNAHLLQRPKRKNYRAEKKQKLRKQLAEQIIERASKKYGTYEHGSLIAGGFYSHWPESVKNKIRKLRYGK